MPLGERASADSRSADPVVHWRQIGAIEAERVERDAEEAIRAREALARVCRVLEKLSERLRRSGYRLVITAVRPLTRT